MLLSLNLRCKILSLDACLGIEAVHVIVQPQEAVPSQLACWCTDQGISKRWRR